MSFVGRMGDVDCTKERGLMKYFLKRLWGTREEIGYVLGRFYAEQGLAWFRPVATPHQIDEEQRAYALRQLELVEKSNPGIVEELGGMAKGLGVSFEQAMAVVLTSGIRRSTQGCTAFVTRGKSGDVYLARNLDFNLTDQNSVCLARFTSPADDFATFGGTEALLGYTEGINEYGVGIAMAVVPMGDHDWETVLPKSPPEQGMLFSIAIRTALESCRSAACAAEFLSSIPHLEPFNFLVADSSGKVALVEAAPWGCKVRSVTTEDKIVITNVFSSPFMKESGRWMDEMMARAQETLSGLRERAVRAACELAEGSVNGLDEETIFALLRMVAFDYEEGDASHTVWSACFNLTKGDIWWCQGTPRRHPFEPIGTVRQPHIH